MKRIKDLETFIPLIITGCLFLILYAPTLNRPYHFEEVKVTKFFHSPPPANISVFSQETIQGSKWDSLWREYLRIQPPGLLYFYRLWSVITKENEILMRLPLFLLTSLCLYQLFFFFRELSSPSESAVILLFTSLSTWWYGIGSIISPNSFTLLFAFLSICLFSRAFHRRKLSFWLILINLCGLSLSYYFIPLVLIQLISLFFFKEAKRLKVFLLLNLLCVSISGGTLYWVTNHRFSNPLAQHWGKVDHKDPLFLFEYLLLGGVREREIEKPKGSAL